jgi:hypothetical protein
LFEYSPCHNHYHFTGFAEYALYDASGGGALAVAGRKQAFCLEDFERWDPNAGRAKFYCGNQGISAGWADVYGSHLDCQWLDITDVAPGTYWLRVTVNPEQILQESNYANNAAEALIVLNADGSVEVP